MSKICFFNTLKFWGGGEKFYLEFAQAFKEKGLQVVIFCKHGSPLSQKAAALDLDQENLNVSTLSFLNPLKILKTKKLLKKHDVHSVVFSTSQDLKLAGLAASLAGVKHIVYRRGLAVPVKGSFINKYLFKNVLTSIVANSAETKKTLLRHMAGVIPENKISIIYNGIKPEEYTKDLEKPLTEALAHRPKIILGNAGRLTNQKRQILLLEVAEKLKKDNLQFVILIAGTGVLEEKLKAEINRRQLEGSVQLIGFQDDMNSFMAAIDVFILTSSWEGFGYVLAEAMIKSKPTVAFDITSNPEVAPDGVSGFLVPHEDVNLLTEKIKLLITDNDLRERLGASAKKWTLEKFSFNSQVEKYVEILNP